MTNPTLQAPPLPHWETTPPDLEAAIRETKAAIRARIEASGRTVEEAFAAVEARVAERVAEIEAAEENVWPILDYADIEAGTVPAETVELVHRRGCALVRGHFEREQALAWDRDILDYVERNNFFEDYRGAGDDFFGSVGSRPEIYPVYWSPAQMEARQSDHMARVQSFLNHRWTYESDGVQWFDPDRDSLYPDRIRRRPPGRLRRPRRPHRRRHARPVDDERLPAGVPPSVRRVGRAVRPAGRLAPHRGGRSTRGRPCARRSAPSRAGPRCRTWRTTRACCSRCRSPRRWPT